MPLVNINRAGIKHREVLEESRRVEKVIQDNLALVNNKFAIATFSATHGTEVGIPNPFGDAGAPSGIQIINTDGTLAPASATMRGLRIAEDGKLGVTVQFQPPQSGSGSIGEFVGPISRVESNALPLTSLGPFNLCTTPSMTVPPGIWQISGFATVLGAAGTTLSSWRVSVSRSTGALSAGDTTGVPTNAELLLVVSSSSTIVTGGRFIHSFSYPATIAASSTLFLVAQAGFGVSTATGYGSLQAVRLAPYLTGYTANVTALFFAP